MTNLIPIDDIRNALQDRRLTVVAEKCGLSHPTVKAIASKAIASGNEKISLNTWKKLSDYLSDSQ
jgi:hypothetical protein